jgi:glycosyltransferase involved in cell wall biosynthesis
MEAMAAGLPVVTTNVGAITEEVDDGLSGFLIAPGDARALAEATLRLARDPQLRLQMSAAARRTAELKFNGSRNYPRLLEVCKRCVQPAPPHLSDSAPGA